MICFQILSLYSITTTQIGGTNANELWFAFRFYLCIQSQPLVYNFLPDGSCDLLSDFIFVFNHNNKPASENETCVVICLQILSLYSITTEESSTTHSNKLWFAFRFYLCIQSQRSTLWTNLVISCDLLSDFIFVFNHNLSFRRYKVKYGCDLLSDFIFVFNHNRRIIHNTQQ